MQTTIHGIPIHYLDEGKGEPLLFVHGYPLSGAAWKKQVEAFRGSYRVIVPDLRGHGQSGSSDEPATMEKVAGDLHELLKQLGTGPVVVIGHSMGGYIALAFARLYPQMLRRLVLVATRAGADSADGAAARRATAEKVKSSGAQFVIDAMAPKMLAAANQDPKLLEEVRATMAASTPQGVAAALLGMAERPDATSTLPKIAVPTFVITGAEDALIPAAESVKMAQAIPDASLEVLPGAGHLVPFEKSVEFNRLLAEWLEGKRVSKPLPKSVSGISATPVFLVDDIVKSAEYYRDVLGFTFDQYYGDPPCFVMLALGSAEIFLSGPEKPGQKMMRPNGKTTGGWDAYIRVSSVGELCEFFRKRGARIAREPERTFYGMREFDVEDVNGYRICFGADE